MKSLLKSIFLTVGLVITVAGAAPSAVGDSSSSSAVLDSSDKTLVPNNDTGIGSDGKIKDGDAYQVRIGELRAPSGESYIMPIRLPSIPAGKQIATAHLRTQLVGVAREGNNLGSADLYGLGVRDLNKALPTDYYEGTTPDAQNTLIQAAFLTPQSPIRTNSNIGPFVGTTQAGDMALAKYLNKFCIPANAGKYLILRLSYTKHPIPSGNDAYNLLTTGADGDNEIPVIIYTLAPAP